MKMSRMWNVEKKASSSGRWTEPISENTKGSVLGEWEDHP
jgi:hypothetical protein